MRPAVERLDEQRLAALEELAEARLALGEHTLVAGELADLVAANPWRERLRAAHLRALYGSGRQREALAAYERFRRRLRDELGLDPSPELDALHQAILRRDASLAPPIPPPAVARTNLPAPASPRSQGGLIGRDDAIDVVRERLAVDRLVTLTGPGGVGKTRLAIEAARALTDRFPDGVWLVELAGRPARADPEALGEIAEQVATALGIREDTVAGLPDDHWPDPTDRLVAALARAVHVAGARQLRPPRHPRRSSRRTAARRGRPGPRSSRPAVSRSASPVR